MALADSDQKATGLKGCGRKLGCQSGWFYVTGPSGENGFWRSREINGALGMEATCGQISTFTYTVRWLCDRCAKQQGVVW